MKLYLVFVIVLNVEIKCSNLSWLNNKVEVNSSVIVEKGIFAKEKINKNELICAWGGKILNEQEVLALSSEQIPRVLQIADNLWIGSDVTESADLVNHSCNPNSGLKGQILLVSLRDINKGEEITMDYAMAVTRFIGMTDFACNCREYCCRKIVSESDWKNNGLQKKYDGYFSEYIQSKINF